MRNESADITPVISVVIPVYNVEDYLPRCLESVGAQTYRCLEIILVDDGSTDRSGAICDDFARQDARVKVIHQANGGLSVARNAGMAVAGGEYIGFVDSDDWIEPDMYATLYDLLRETDADIAVCTHFRDKDGQSKAKHCSGRKQVLGHDEALKALARDKLVRNYAWDKLYKRSLFQGIEFPPGRFCEDIPVAYRVFDRACTVAVLEQPKYHYVLRGESIMRGRYNPQKEYHLFEGLCEQYEFMQARGWGDITSAAVVRRGVHLLEHLAMVAPTAETRSIWQHVVQELHRHTAPGWRSIGVSTVWKRWLIFHCPFLYGTFYRFYRAVFKSAKYRF